MKREFEDTGDPSNEHYVPGERKRNSTTLK